MIESSIVPIEIRLGNLVDGKLKQASVVSFGDVAGENVGQKNVLERQTKPLWIILQIWAAPTTDTPKIQISF